MLLYEMGASKHINQFASNQFPKFSKFSTKQLIFSTKAIIIIMWKELIQIQNTLEVNYEQH